MSHPDPSRTRRRRQLTALALAVVCMALVLHWAYWYRPRPRVSTPRADGIAAEMLRDPAFDVAVWMPYPRQNLLALEHHTGDLRELIASVARLSGMPRIQLPQLGPFRFPPASELVWAASADGGSWQVAIRLYPTASVLLRAAGFVAANPWLKGGSVESGGRRLYVSWHGRTWTLATQPSSGSGLRSADSDAPGSRRSEFEGQEFGLILLRSPRGLIPAGLYRVEPGHGGLRVVMGRTRSEISARDEVLSGKGLAMTVVHASAAGSHVGIEALAVTGEAVASGSLRLPSAVLVRRGDASRLKLPGEASLRRLGIRPQTLRSGAWTLSAWDESAMRAGRLLLPVLDAWIQPGTVDEMAFDIDVATLGRWTGDLGEGFGAVPLVGAGLAQKWIDLARVAAACGPDARLSGVIESSPAAVVVRLEPRPRSRPSR